MNLALAGFPASGIKEYARLLSSVRFRLRLVVVSIAILDDLVTLAE